MSGLLSIGMAFVVSLLVYFAEESRNFSLFVFGVVLVFAFPLFYWLFGSNNVANIEQKKDVGNYSTLLELRFKLRDVLSTFSQTLQILIPITSLSGSIIYFVFGNTLLGILFFITFILLGGLFYWMNFLVEVFCTFTDKGLFIGRDSQTQNLILGSQIKSYSIQNEVVSFEVMSPLSLRIPLLNQRPTILGILQKYVRS